MSPGRSSSSSSSSSTTTILFIFLLWCCCSHVRTQDAGGPILVFLWDESVLDDRPAWIDSFLPANNLFNVSLVARDLTHISALETSQIVCDLASDGAVVFVAMLSCPSLTTVQSLLRDLRVPLIAVNTECALGSDVYSHAYPPPMPDMSAVLKDVALAAQWEDVSLIFEESTVSLVEVVHAALQGNGTSVHLNKIYPEVLAKNVTDLLLRVQNNPDTPTNFLVFCEDACVQELLSQAIAHDKTNNNHGLYSFKAQWLFALERPALDWLPSHVGDIDNVAAVVRVEEQANNSMVFAQEILYQSYYMLHDILNALPSTNYTHDVTACGHRLQMASLLANELELEIPRSYCHNCTTYEVYSAFIGPDKARDLQEVAMWSGLGLFRRASIFPNTHFGLNGRHLVIGVNTWGPFMQVSPESPHGFDGMCMEIIAELTEGLNFSFSLELPPDGEWGVKNADGSWTGLVGQLQRKDVALTVAPLMIHRGRQEVMDFTEFFYLTYSTVLVKMPDPDANKWQLYLSPFRWKVWMLVGLAIPLSGFFIWALTRTSPFYSIKAAREGLGVLNDALLYTMASFFTQGSEYLPDAQSGRFYFGFWYMFCLVVVATYSGNLIAFLTVSKTSLAFSTLDEMLDQDSIKFGTLGGSIYMTAFQETRDHTLAKVYERMVDFNKTDSGIFSVNNTLHMDKVKRKSYAYINDKTGFEIAMAEECDLDIIKEEFMPAEYALGLQNNSYFRGVFSAEIKKMKEGGLIHKWKSKWWPRQTFCSRGLITESKPVTVIDMQGAYYLLGMLLAVAIVALVSEAVFKKLFAGTCKGLFPSHRSQNESHPRSEPEHANGNTPVPVSGESKMSMVAGDRKMSMVAGDRKMSTVDGDRKMSRVGGDRKMSMVGGDRKMSAMDGHVTKRSSHVGENDDVTTERDIYHTEFGTEFTTEADYSTVTEYTPREEIPMEAPPSHTEVFESAFTYN